MSSPDSEPKLKPIHLAALMILMAEAREVTNKEFTDMANFTLTGKERAVLEGPGYIESRKIGQLLAFQLTDKGWAFCKRLHAAKVDVSGSLPARSIYVLLGGLGRSLERLHVSHAEFFKQPAKVTSSVQPIAPTGDHDVEARIRAAYAELPKATDGWVGLADLRDQLRELDRETVDDVLRAMARQDGVRIIPVANTKSLKPRDRAAALRIGVEDNHALWIGPA
jgi:hypothetical protein